MPSPTRSWRLHEADGDDSDYSDDGWRRASSLHPPYRCVRSPFTVTAHRTVRPARIPRQHVRSVGCVAVSVGFACVLFRRPNHVSFVSLHSSPTCSTGPPVSVRLLLVSLPPYKWRRQSIGMPDADCGRHRRQVPGTCVQGRSVPSSLFVSFVCCSPCVFLAR